MKAIAAIIAFFLASPAAAFEANVIWLKGNVELAERKKLDPTVNISAFEVGNDEPVTVYITYRAPARNDQNWAKVTFRVSMVNPQGQSEEPAEESKRWIVAGEGILTDEHLQDWGASHGRTVLTFSKGNYSAKNIENK